MLLGTAERANVGAWTATLMVVVALRVPEVAVMVTAVVDTGAEAPAVRVRTLLDEVGLVPHVAVTPVGSVEVTARVTLPVNHLRH